MANTTFNDYLKAFRAAFPLTMPVLAGFSVLGIAYGVLMHSMGLGAGWSFLTSALVYAGSMQYVALSLFATAFSPLTAFIVALTVNARHFFYGLSVLDKLNHSGKYKPYIVFALSDEAFSLLSSSEAPDDVEPGIFMFAIAFLCQLYWVLASVAGALMGQAVSFSLEGLDFALTAMFIVIFINQWEQKENRRGLLTGVAFSVLALIIFGADKFIIPAMILIVAGFALGSSRLWEGGL